METNSVSNPVKADFGSPRKAPKHNQRWNGWTQSDRWWRRLYRLRAAKVCTYREMQRVSVLRTFYLFAQKFYVVQVGGWANLEMSEMLEMRCLQEHSETGTYTSSRNDTIWKILDVISCFQPILFPGKLIQMPLMPWELPFELPKQPTSCCHQKLFQVWQVQGVGSLENDVNDHCSHVQDWRSVINIFREPNMKICLWFFHCKNK